MYDIDIVSAATWSCAYSLPMNEKNWTRIFVLAERERENQSKWHVQNGCPGVLFLSFPYGLRSSLAKL